jgi:hypothetical protein
MSVSNSPKYRRLSLSVFPYLGNSYSILSFFGGSWPVSRILTSAVELGSKSPESMKKKSGASKKQERVGSFIIRILDLVSLIGASGPGISTFQIRKEGRWEEKKYTSTMKRRVSG